MSHRNRIQTSGSLEPKITAQKRPTNDLVKTLTAQNKSILGVMCMGALSLDLQEAIDLDLLISGLLYEARANVLIPQTSQAEWLKVIRKSYPNAKVRAEMTMEIKLYGRRIMFVPVSYY